MNTYQITVLPYDRILNADEGENLLHVLQQNSLAPDAPCGGNGKCGKCIVYINDRETLACQTVIRDNITVRIPEKSDMQILKHGTSVSVQPDGRDTISEARLLSVIFWTVSPVRNLPKKVY